MTRLTAFLALLLSLPLVAQDVFVPPVPKGIASDKTGRVRKPFGEISFPNEQSTWIRVRSERFEIYSNASKERTRELIADVETLAAALMTSSDRFGPPKKRATVFVFDDREDSQPYFDLLFSQQSVQTSGAYVRYDGGGTMIIDGSRNVRRPLSNRDPGIRTAMHELMHDLLRQSDSVPPLWLEEGLAEYFSNAVVKEGRVTAGSLIREHVYLLRHRNPFPLEKFLTVKAESADSTNSHFYAQSWAAVHWLMGLDAKAFFPFLHDVESGMPVFEALQLHYKKTLSDLESAMVWHRVSARRVTLAGRPAQPFEEPQLIDRATLLYELGRFLSHIAGAETETQRHYREAVRINPKHARALAALGELEAAVAAAPRDAEVHVMYAETLLTTALGPFAGIFEPAAGDRDKFLKARALAERALQLGGVEGVAQGILGTTYLVESDLAPGIAALERARELVPQRMDFALNLYSMYLRGGERTKAAALFASAFENARDQQTVFAARNALVVSETARANALANSGKLDEAAALIGELAAATSDPKGRADYEAHAAKLAATAEVNRHILRYNEAIALANGGKNREAIQLLDELLAVATDAKVVDDVKKLRADLRKR